MPKWRSWGDFRSRGFFEIAWADSSDLELTRRKKYIDLADAGTEKLVRLVRFFFGFCKALHTAAIAPIRSGSLLGHPNVRLQWLEKSYLGSSRNCRPKRAVLFPKRAKKKNQKKCRFRHEKWDFGILEFGKIAMAPKYIYFFFLLYLTPKCSDPLEINSEHLQYYLYAFNYVLEKNRKHFFFFHRHSRARI